MTGSPSWPWRRGQQTVLVGADGRPGGEQALRSAGELAVRLPGLRILVGLVLPAVTTSVTGPFVEELRDDLELDVMLEASRILDPLGVDWQLATTTGEPAHGLHQLAEDHDVTLIVLGTHGPGTGPALRRVVNGSVSAHLVHHETRPVLVVPCSRHGV